MFRAVATLILLFFASPAFAQSTNKIPIIIDTDIGDDIDDALALALALSSPELDIRGITTGTGDAHTRALMVCRLLHAVGRDDIAVAAAGKSREKPDYNGQLQYGLRPSFRKRPERASAVEFLYQQLKARPGELTIVALGPLTNLAELLTQHADAKPWIKRIVFMGGALRVGYESKPPVEAEWNICSDIKAARTVFASGIPLVVAPLDATADLKLPEPLTKRIVQTATPLCNQLHALYQLWDKPTPVMFDPVAVALCFTEKFCRMEELALDVDDKGITRAIKGKANARVATSIRRDEFLAWYVERIAPASVKAVLPRLPLTNVAKPVPRGLFPHLVHVVEDYETDIERRWWLSGRLETKHVPPGSKGACRAVLTNDFDDRMGDAKAMYQAVIFNPVPGPPMGKNTRVAFRYWLKGAKSLRVQIYTLSKGYHRHLTLTELPQASWQSATVDMTQARRPDGSGGALAEDERIDDLQFYTDPDAELYIDDIVLYDAAPVEEKRPFPERLIFTGWFDTGKQGKEWPGLFDLVPKKPPHTWRAAQSVPGLNEKGAHLRVHLRGERPLGATTQLRFRYQLTGTNLMRVALVNATLKDSHVVEIQQPKLGAWTEMTLDFTKSSRRQSNQEGAPRQGDFVTEIQFVLPLGGQLLVDDVLLYDR
jgi:purine nucleosidase